MKQNNELQAVVLPVLLVLLIIPATTAFHNKAPARRARQVAVHANSPSSSSSSSSSIPDRRQAITTFTSSLVAATAAASLLGPSPPPANAAATNEADGLPPYPAEVTAKAYFDIRITGFVTGEEKATSEDFVGRLVFGLFGNAAPLAVGEFLKYSKAKYGGNLPSYAFSNFIKRTPGVSVQAGRIKGLKEIEIAGSRQYEYGDQVLGSRGIDEPKLNLKHDRRGLLTKSSSQDAIDSQFDITLGPLPALDNGDSLVFGVVLEGQAALDAIENVPIYTYESTGDQPEALNELFSQQKKLFLSVAKSLNDERAVNRQGSFLKRVEVLDVGVL